MLADIGALCRVHGVPDVSFVAVSRAALSHPDGTARAPTGWSPTQGESLISVQNYAVAMIDELDHPQHTASGSPWRIDAAHLQAEDHQTPIDI
ncbi:MAG: hypothetical protein ACREXX_06275 [Gammaproteobacteria bacterium]